MSIRSGSCARSGRTARYDIPYVLELLVCPFLGSANHTADYVESPGKLPGLVIESVREFAKPEYGVDLLKLESPLAANSLPARDGNPAALAAKEFDAIGDICRERSIPWVLLSGDAAPEKFERMLEFAFAAGAGGFLAGRTIWLNAVLKNFPDRAAVAASLRKGGVAVLERLNDLTMAKGTQWKARFPVFADIKQEGYFVRRASRLKSRERIANHRDRVSRELHSVVIRQPGFFGAEPRMKRAHAIGLTGSRKEIRCW
jgi:tagatose 1,6-diphosphate aldolase